MWKVLTMVKDSDALIIILWCTLTPATPRGHNLIDGTTINIYEIPVLLHVNSLVDFKW